MRGFLWLLAFVFIALIGAFIAAPGEKADELFQEVQTRWTEDGIAGLGEGAADGSIAGLFTERVRELGAYVDAQIDEELATIDKIQSGEIQIGGSAPEQSAPSAAEDNVSAQAPETAQALSAKVSPAAPPETGKAAKSPPLAAPTTAVQPQKAAAPASAASPDIDTQQTPQTEDMLSAIIKQEDRSDQAAKTEFWTEERINEALENGEPTSGGKRACLFGCD